MTPVPNHCEFMNGECARRFDDIDTKLKDIDTRQRTHGESIAALRAQVAAYAALGSLIGGGAVALVAKLLKV